MNNATMYVINALLVLMVIRQIREHPLDLRSLAGPVLAVGAGERGTCPGQIGRASCRERVYGR